MDHSGSSTNRSSSKRIRQFVRRNSDLIGDAAEIIVLPKNRRSTKRRRPSAKDPEADIDNTETELDPHERHFPWVITALVLIQIGMMLFAKKWTWLSLCYDPFRRHEVWRFVTLGLLHRSFGWAMAETLIFQLLYGLTLEAVHGRRRIGAIYFFGIFSGSLMVTVVTPKTYVMGSAAGVYGLMGSHFATLILNWGQMEYRTLRLACIFAYPVVNFLGSYYLQTISLEQVVLLGGAVGGFITSLLLLQNFEVLKWEETMKGIAGKIGVLAFVIIVILNVSSTEYYYPTQFNFNYVQTFVNYTLS